MRHLLCLRCSHVSELDENQTVSGCPSCGDSTGIPADYSVRPEFKITWHELRCLVIWAERWASQCEEGSPGMMKIVYGIADRLHAQHMDGPALTFSQELADLRAEVGEVQQSVIKEPEEPLR